MSRPLRVEYPGAYYHVMSHGNGRQWIVKEKQDFLTFRRFIGEITEKYNLKIYSFVLMRNHYHLLIETLDDNLSQAMAMLNRNYAKYLNRRNKRYGSIFKPRFKAIVIQEEEYYLVLGKYIHRNPLRAGLVEKVEDYPWSSYPYIIGKLKDKEISRYLDIGATLVRFGRKKKEAILRYKEFVEEEFAEEKAIKKGIRLGNWFMGSKEWIKGQMNRIGREKEKENQVKGRNKIGIIQDPEKLVEIVAKALRKDIMEIKNPGYSRSDGMRIAIYILSRYSPMKEREIGKLMGGRSSRSISMHLHEFKKYQLPKKKCSRIIKKVLLNYGIY